MQRTTQLVIGATLAALAVLLVGLAFVDQDGQVARVPDILTGRSQATLIGVPQAERVPVRAAGGQVELAPNPDYASLVSWQKAWLDGDTLRHSVYSLTLVATDGQSSSWSLRNATRTAGQPGDPEVGEAAWTIDGYVPVLVEDFHDGDQSTPRLWALLQPEHIREPLSPKPSQFTGRLLERLPDGTPLPDGALLWAVDDFKVGCSSKFLPPEERARREASGDL